MRVALKIAYDGREFHGYARQPDMRTVEGEVLYALWRAGLVPGREAANVRGASRTDAGVSALGNVVAFDTDAAAEAIIGRFNDTARGVWAWAIALLPPGFDPRRARERWYRYHLSGPHDTGVLRGAGERFIGTHNFAAFATPDAPHPKRRIDSLEVARAEDGVLVDVRAPSFLRGMVRRIVAALLAVERSDVTPDDLEKALAAGRGSDWGLATPEPLVLMDVDLGFPFRPAIDRACRERVLARGSAEVIAARFWREAADRVRPDPPNV